MNIRINKLLSDLGLGSRREVEQLVRDGRVTINGLRATLSDVVEQEDTVLLDDEELPVEDIMREYIAEQKMRIAEQLVGNRLGDSYYDDEPAPLKTNKRQRPQQGKGFAKTRPNKAPGRPAKFKKHEEDEGAAKKKDFAKKKKPRTTRDRSSDEGYSYDDGPHRPYHAPHKKKRY